MQEISFPGFRFVLIAEFRVLDPDGIKRFAVFSISQPDEGLREDSFFGVRAEDLDPS